jgi:heat shock protein HtpX
MNTLKTFMLMAGLTALFAWLGSLIGGQQGMVMALAFAGVSNLIAWWFSDKIVLSMYRAQPLTEGRLHGLTAQLAGNAGIPMPKLYLIPNEQPNAFATGRNPAHGAVAVTQGLVDMLNERELAGVIAHELAHIKHRDSLTMTLTATLAGALGYLANFFLFFGGSREREGTNPIVAIAIMILAPMAAMLVQMAISRTREYAADKAGAEISGDPLALASALEKIDAYAHRIRNPQAEANPATAHMFIISPLSGGGMDNLFATHPSTANRIRALGELAGAMPAENRRYAFDLSEEEVRDAWKGTAAGGRGVKKQKQTAPGRSHICTGLPDAHPAMQGPRAGGLSMAHGGHRHP